MRRLLVGLAATALACSPKLDKPGDGAQIICSRDSECPAPWICGQSGMCFGPTAVSVDLAVVRPSGATQDDVARSAAIQLQLTVDPADRVTFALDGDLVEANPADFKPLPKSPYVFGATLKNPRNGVTSNVVVLVADAFGSVTRKSLAIAYDDVPPAAPAAPAFGLFEDSRDRGDAAAAPDAEHVFTVAALPGTVTLGDADRFEVLDASGGNVLATGSVRDDGSADMTGAIPAAKLATPRSVWVRLLDAAGNASPDTSLVAPSPTIAFPNPLTAYSTGNLVEVQSGDALVFTEVYLAGGPGKVANLLPESLGLYDYNVAAGDPDGDYAVLAYAAANGSVGLAGAGVVFDQTPPVLDASKIVIHQNPPGTADTVEGLAGAVVDQPPNAGLPSVTVRFGSNAVSVAANPDGSFGPVAVGDNAVNQVTISAKDLAQNAAAATAALDNDIAPPDLYWIASSKPTAGLGQSIAITFEAADASALAANPTVTVNGHPAAFASVVPGANPANLDFTYDYVILPSDPQGDTTVIVAATDANGNANAVTQNGILSIDAVPPSSAILVPSAGSWSGRPAVSGQASDDVSGVASVSVGIEDTLSGKWFDGAGFNSATALYPLAASGTLRWGVDTSAITFTAGKSYFIQSRATDGAGNVEAPTSGVTVTCTATSPAAPTGFTAQPVGEARVRLAWTPSAGASGYRLYYDVEGTPATVLGGPGSPVAIPGGATATYDATELPRGRWTFALTAVDSAGNESALSAPASAASRWWTWPAAAPLGGDDFAAAALGASDPGQTSPSVIVVGAGGSIVRSGDGTSYQPVRSGVSADLGAIATSGDYAFAGGGRGAFLRSTDRGQTWTRVALPGFGTSTVNAIAANGARVMAVGAGGAAATSADSGATWTQVTLPSVTGDLLAVAASATDFVVGGTGGNVWYGSSTFAHVSVSTADVTAAAQDASGNAYVLASNGLVYAAVPGATRTFVQAGSFSPSSDDYRWLALGPSSMAIASLQHLAYGNNRNGTSVSWTWGAVPPYSACANNFGLAGDGDVYYSGGGNSSGGACATKLDHQNVTYAGPFPFDAPALSGAIAYGGNPTFLGTRGWLFAPGRTYRNDVLVDAVAVAGDAVITAASGYHLQRSTDFGLTFAEPAFPGAPQTPWACSSGTNPPVPLWASGQDVMAVLNDGVVGCTLWRSTDGGQTFVRASTPPPNATSMTALYGVGQNRVAAVGGSLWSSQDGGDHWADVSPAGASVTAYASIAGDATTLLALGQTATDVVATHSSDGGMTWSAPVVVRAGVASPSARVVGGGDQFALFPSAPAPVYGTSNTGASFALASIADPNFSAFGLWSSGTTFLATGFTLSGAGGPATWRSTTGAGGTWASGPDVGQARLFGGAIPWAVATQQGDERLSFSLDSGATFTPSSHFVTAAFPANASAMAYSDSGLAVIGGSGVLVTFGPP